MCSHWLKFKKIFLSETTKSQEDFLNFDQSEHIMGPVSHVGFQISTKNTNLVEDHPMNIFSETTKQI
jgi:hypothetical protein